MKPCHGNVMILVCSQANISMLVISALMAFSQTRQLAAYSHLLVTLKGILNTTFDCCIQFDFC